MPFFREVSDLTVRPLSAEALQTLRFTDDNLRLLIVVTMDLAAESHLYSRRLRALSFESLMQVVESGAVRPEHRKRFGELSDQWDRTIDEHAQSLKASFDEPTAKRVDDWVRSGKSMYGGLTAEWRDRHPAEARQP
ncbi:MAG: hypothetical protein ABI823_13620 [Bryobacteraceae bacterium]